MTLVSVVIPAFNAEDSIFNVASEIVEFTSRVGLNCEIIIVDDGSSDATWYKVCSLSNKFSNVRGIQLMRSYGQHLAVMCGLRESQGEVVITMDDDGQHDVRQIPRFLRARSENNFDVVFAKFADPQKTAIRRFVSTAMRPVYEIVGSGQKLPPISSYRLLGPRAISAIKSSTKSEMNINAELIVAGLNLGSTDIEHLRSSGKGSRYTMLRLAQLAKRVIVGYTTKPLRWVSRLAVAVALATLLFSVGVVVVRIANGQVAPGWASLFVALHLLSFPILITLAVIAEYLAVHIESNRSTSQYTVRSYTKNLVDQTTTSP